MTSYFLMATTNIFPGKNSIAKKNFSFFFQLQIEFCTETNLSKKNLHVNFNFCLHNVALDTQKMNFCPFL